MLITIDTLRADHLGCYGYHRILTPTIDKLASEGIRYERAYARLALQYREDGDAARARQYYQKACNLSEEVCRELLAQL